MYLLDTDWVLQAFRGEQRVVRLLEQLRIQPTYVSLITLGEIYEGAFYSSNPDAHLMNLRHFFGAYPVLLLSEPIMGLFAELRASLRRRGQLIPDFDLLIAATALHHDLTLLTFNRRHFERIPDLRLYPS
jgi:tRNA(fMet)-specific endonuclease VapC